MKNYFHSELALILYIVVGSLGLGFIFGYPLIGVLTGLIFYIGWSLLQVYQLNGWIERKKKGRVPEVRGIYGYFVNESLKQKSDHKRENKKLKAALVRQRDLMEGIRDAAILIDGAGNIQWFNREARQMFNLKPSRDTGLAVIKLIREPDFVKYLSKGKYADPIAIKYPPNTQTWLEASITKYKNSDRIILLRDITRLRRLETMRRDFIGNLSHELRTPLTVLRGYLETLQIHPKADPAFKHIFDQMEDQGMRMANLLKDLTTLSRLESLEEGRILAPVEISFLMDRIIKDAKGLDDFDGHDINSVLEPDYYINGVESELYSALGNLVFNAIRHTPPGTKISVSVTRPKSGLRIVVEDDGPGIEEHHLPHLTERFYRVDKSRNSNTGGTGLGLAIVKHALASHGGRLNIKSKVGEGSKFSCLFSADKLVDINGNKSKAS